MGKVPKRTSRAKKVKRRRGERVKSASMVDRAAVNKQELKTTNHELAAKRGDRQNQQRTQSIAHDFGNDLGLEHGCLPHQ